MTSYTIQASQLLVNDHGDGIRVTGVGAASSGSVTLSGTTISYTPGSANTDSFSYTISDQYGQTASATVTISVTTGTGSAPVQAVDDVIDRRITL